MGQGKPEALAHCPAGVWGRLHAVVVAATVSVCVCVSMGVCVCVCTHVREQAGRKERGGGEWLALERGEGGWEMERAVAHGKKKKKGEPRKEREAKRQRGRA